MPRITRSGLLQVGATALLAALVAAGVTVLSSVTSPADTSPVKADVASAAKLEAVGGTKLKRVELTAESAKRFGLQTTPVRAGQLAGPPAGKATLLVPYSSIIYDPSGATWVYTPVKALVFVRHKVVVELILADLAAVLEGPPAGTEVVSVGASELYGTELGVGGKK
jgi:hypothetical protein